MSDQAEYRLTCVVAELLRFTARPGVHWFHVPNGEYRSARTGARLKRMGVKAGEPDFVILKSGRAIGLELKTEKGRQTSEQRDIEGDWIRAGGIYQVCKGYRAAVDFLVEHDCIWPVDQDTRFAPRQEEAA